MVIGVVALLPDSGGTTARTDQAGGGAGQGAATFEVGAENASGRLVWPTGETDARQAPYLVTFTASNAKSGSDSTWITVTRAMAPGDSSSGERSPAGAGRIGTMVVTVSGTSARG